MSNCHSVRSFGAYVVKASMYPAKPEPVPPMSTALIVTGALCTYPVPADVIVTEKTRLLDTTTVACAPVPGAELIGTFEYVPLVYNDPWFVIAIDAIEPVMFICVGPKPTPSSLSVTHCSTPWL